MLRIGHGYDVHKLVVGRKLILGGVDIPNTMGLLGHSDADVLVHALIDAILGSLALGDIGQHFHDTNNAYKDVDSIKLLARIIKICHENGYVIGNIDTTIIAQEPKLSSYIFNMRNNIAKICGCDVSQISIKATTEEKLGFTGAKLGISAHAVVLVVSINN